jgi:hypothetical protein
LLTGAERRTRILGFIVRPFTRFIMSDDALKRGNVGLASLLLAVYDAVQMALSVALLDAVAKFVSNCVKKALIVRKSTRRRIIICLTVV